MTLHRTHCKGLIPIEKTDPRGGDSPALPPRQKVAGVIRVLFLIIIIIILLLWN
ncbi:hypothetical protein ASPTUDRAFT_45764 [Aspergillus tubingensis CBS 134.48]|uniref:Uncharacterized protein n=1 Tax=Aspergillus tubingensis (strain CBS 134.48) TaxID=767770 RepID=A0A1L9MZ45_ASPTC|nr:hypothetical protein ASPTUDRAFT_45764 [Aspergillus tubingensis CBS 134.48]